MIFSEDFLRKLELLRLELKRQGGSPEEADKKSKRTGQSPEFLSYRSYSQGDDYRYIDWNAYARLGQFFIKQFSREQAVSSYILLDNSPSMTDSKLDGAKKIAASIAYITLANIGRVRLITGGSDITFVGHTDCKRMFNHVEKIGQSKLDMKQILRNSISGLKASPILFVISDLWEKEMMDELLIISKIPIEISIIHLLSSEELNPDIKGKLELIDRETRDKKKLYIDKSELDQYKTLLEEHLTKWKDFSLKNSINYVFIPPQISMEHAIFVLLRQANILG